MIKRLRMMLMMAVLGVAWAAVPVSAELATMGEPIDPHGFPSYYGDTNGLQLEPCLPEPAGFATRPELCVFDPLDPESDILVAGEIFWWIAVADVPTATGDAEVTLAIEGTFGGPEAPVDGQQISFGRTRIRVDTPVAGTYTVTHPYGTQEFEVTVDTLADGINYTADIGAADFRDPAAGFLGTLSAPIGPYLTWPDYETNGLLQVWEEDELGNPVLDENENPIVLEQYVGDPNQLSQVVGSAIVNENHESGFQNFFRVDGPAGSNLDGNGNDFVETDLFSVSGKVFDPNQDRTAHVFPEIPLPKLYGMGPINRVEPFATPTTAEVTGIDLDYPVGYPLWYQENIGTIQEPAPGLQLTICSSGTAPVPVPGSIEAMCISDPIDPTDEAQTTLRTGGETFYWSADAEAANGDDDFELVLGLEGTFGGDESIVDGGQITFGRERIRIDTNVSGAGTYRITHPYAVRIFEGVIADDRGINFTADIGITDPADPDGAMIGTIFSDIGPQVLKWTTFNADPALNDPLLVRDHPTIPGAQVHFVGDPAIPHEVVGSPTGNNFFRVEKLDEGGTVEEGPWTILDETDLFAISGQVFDPALFEGLIIGDSAGVFRNGRWYLDSNNSGLWEPGTDTVYSFGIANDLPVTGDWNSDSFTEIGVFRNGTWYLDSNGNGVWEAGIDTLYRFGIAGDIPVTGDWNGDGVTNIGVFRNGDWFLDTSGDGVWTAGVDTRYRFGIAGDVPITGDWNGDGITQIGVNRDRNFYLDSSSNGAWSAVEDTLYSFGNATDVAVTGDWDGDGTTQIGVLRGYIWFLDLVGDGVWNGTEDRTFPFGTAGDIPVTGRW